jgi:hypothetical protein
MTLITGRPNRRSVELTVIVHVNKLRSVELCIKETVRKWTIKDPTVLGDSRTWQLVLQVVQLIVHDNPSVANFIGKIL